MTAIVTGSGLDAAPALMTTGTAAPGATSNGMVTHRAGGSADWTAHHCVVFLHFHGLKAARFIHGAQAAEMTGVARLGFVVRICLNPRGAAGGSIRDHAIEQRRGNPMPSERRGDDEARNSDH
jgi:hypothetical protein